MYGFSDGITKLRATVLGEILWTLGLALAFAIHLAALNSAFIQPQLIDFAAFVDNARAWQDGNPYPQSARDPNTPHMLLIFLPFINIPLRLSLAIWMAMSYGCAWLSLRLLTRESGLRLKGAALITALAILAASPPILGVVADGNMIWPLWLLFTVSWIADRRGQSVTSGLVMGVLMSVKPFLAVWLGYWAVRGRWTAMGAAVASLLATLAVGVAATGLETWAAWAEMLDRIAWYDSERNASVVGFAARVAGAPYGSAGLTMVGVAAAIGGWTLWRRRRDPDVDVDWLITFLTAMLLSPLAWRYYYCFGLGPAILALRTARQWQAATITILALLPVFVLPDSTPLARATVGSLAFWSLLLAWSISLRISRSLPASRTG